MYTEYPVLQAQYATTFKYVSDCGLDVKRKAQTNASAAGSLIGVILLIFLFYIIFLPPTETEKILAEDPQYIGGPFSTPPGMQEQNVLVREGIGTLDYSPAEGLKIPIPNAFLEATTETKLRASAGFFTVKKFFKSTRKSFDFKSETGNAILTYQIQKGSGVLRILVNGKVVFEDRVTTPSPVILSDLNNINTITFEVSGRFFESKKYNVMDVKIVENVPLVDKQRMSHSFTIKEHEYNNLERAILTYYPNCLQNDVGALTIKLNGVQLSQNVPTCDTINVEEIDKSELRAGKNTLEFFLDSGKAQLEQGTVELSFGNNEGYLKYFSLPARLEIDAQRGLAKVIMKLTFVDDGQPKRAITNVNGVLDAIDQKEPIFERDISRIIRGGNNYIRITPRNTIDILELEIRVE